MTITRSQIESWNPALLTEIGNAWTVMGSKIEGLFDRYKTAVADVNGGHWQGVAADAALARADSDRQAAVRLVDHLNRVAQIAINGFHQVDAPLQQARNAIAGAEHAGFTVSEDLTVSKSDIASIDEQQAMEQWQNEITDAATAAQNADNDVRNNLNAARGDLRVAFTSPETLDVNEARSDAQQLLKDPSHLSPLAEQRLVDAGLLTQSQLAALQSGDPVAIPAAQMEYLNALARSLDGKSSQDIEAVMNKLPADARQGLANALQLLSTPTVTASVRGDSQIPTSGAASLLPRKMYESLTRKDLTTQGWQDIGGYPYNVINLNGVADNRAAARIADMSSPALQHGTGLDTAVFNAGASYLHSQVIAQNNPDDMYFVDGRGQEPTAALTEPMFSAIGNDKAVVSSELTSANGQSFLSDVFNNKWSDHGKSVSSLFHIGAHDAVATPGDRPSEVRATESGQIGETVARYMSDHSKQLLDLPGDPGTAVGQRNPDLMINLANDLAPYYSTFAGSESIPGVGHFENSSQLAAMYSVLATDPTAGVDAAVATWGQQNAMATAYGAGHAPYTYAQSAGQMQHALETGTASAQTALNQGDAYRANWKEAVEGAQYDTAYKAAGAVLGYVPGAGGTIKDLLNVVGPALKPDIVGIVDPSAVTNPSNGIPYQHAANQLDTNATVQDIVNGLAIKDPSVVNDPAFAPYRRPDARGNPTIRVDDLTAQAAISDRLMSRYGLDVQRWEYQFDTGMNGGTIVPAR
jgi:hypothetical protein